MLYSCIHVATVGLKGLIEVDGCGSLRWWRRCYRIEASCDAFICWGR